MIHGDNLSPCSTPACTWARWRTGTTTRGVTARGCGRTLTSAPGSAATGRTSGGWDTPTLLLMCCSSPQE